MPIRNSLFGNLGSGEVVIYAPSFLFSGDKILLVSGYSIHRMTGTRTALWVISTQVGQLFFGSWPSATVCAIRIRLSLAFTAALELFVEGFLFVLMLATRFVI